MLELRQAALLAAALAIAAACDGPRAPAAPAPAPTPTVPEPAPNVIRGTVLDFQTGATVAHATVRVARNIDDPGLEVVADAQGRYTLPPQPALPTGSYLYYFWINTRPAGFGYPVDVHYRGDLLFDAGPCVSRYGVVLDSRTLRPIAGATVGSKVTTGSDGYYRIDWGCPADGTIGYNTTFLSASHPDYAAKQIVVGRGIQRVLRLDFLLDRQ